MVVGNRDHVAVGGEALAKPGAEDEIVVARAQQDFGRAERAGGENHLARHQPEHAALAGAKVGVRVGDLEDPGVGAIGPCTHGAAIDAVLDEPQHRGAGVDRRARSAAVRSRLTSSESLAPWLQPVAQSPQRMHLSSATPADDRRFGVSATVIAAGTNRLRPLRRAAPSSRSTSNFAGMLGRVQRHRVVDRLAGVLDRRAEQHSHFREALAPQRPAIRRGSAAAIRGAGRRRRRGSAITPALISEPPPRPFATTALTSAPTRTSNRPFALAARARRAVGGKADVAGEIGHARWKHPRQVLAAALEHADRDLVALAVHRAGETRGGYRTAIAAADDDDVEIDGPGIGLRIARVDELLEAVRNPRGRSAAVDLLRALVGHDPDAASGSPARAIACARSATATGLCKSAMPAASASRSRSGAVSPDSRIAGNSG